MSNYTLLQQLKIRLRKFNTDDVTGEVTFDNSQDLILQQLLDEAMQEIITYRGYPASWDKDRVIEDMSKFEGIALKLALYDYNKEGSEFEESNTENGDVRKFVSRQSILNDITPLVTVL